MMSCNVYKSLMPPSCRWNSQVTTFLTIQCISALVPIAVANISHYCARLTEKRKKEMMMNYFAWAAKRHFRISGVLQAYFSSFKSFYQHGYWTPIQSKQPKRKKKTGIFIKTASKMPYCKISNVFNRSCHSSKLIMYASAHHPHTTLGVGEQVISLLSEYSRI